MAIKTDRTGFEIAVIGMAGAFPNATSIDEFWQNLVSGQDCIDVFTTEELLEAGVEPSLLDNPNFVKAKGVFPDIDKFDADFFGYTPGDVAMMDPQVRLLHQGVYHALEDAGYANDTQGKKRNIGLFAGASGNFTWELDTFLQATQSAAGQFAALQLNDKDFLATRLAYKLDLHGPAISVHTACSTSLLAVDMACRHIYTGACSMAVAAGAGLTLPHKNGYGYEDGMIKSADGKCRAFSDDANGTIEGNGMAAVVLKSLEEAEADGDQIYAIIRGSAINNDGERKVGYTAPSVDGQAEVIRRALFLSEVNAETVGYVEAHGTGTNLGDPVEIEALKKAFRTDKQNYCGIGSLKSNIGHMDTAAGAGSFIKAVLSLQNQLIPPSINISEPNKNIDFANSPFFLVENSTPWQRLAHPDNPNDQLPLRAGVSSFGIGGTNVHVILEEAPVSHAHSPEASALETNAHEANDLASARPWHVLSLAGADRDGLSRIHAQLADFLHQNPTISPADLCFTWHKGRGGLPVRQAIVFQSIDALAQGLSNNDFNPELMAKDQLTDARTAFMFPGQGTQYPAMSQQLYHTLPEYADALNACLAVCDSVFVDPKYLGEFAQQDEQNGTPLSQVRNLLLSNASDDNDALIAQTHMTQVCLFIVEYAMAKTLMQFGVKPDVMIGHSLGEFVAATLAGVFTLEQAITAVSLRGRLMQVMQPGAMMAVNAEEADITPLLADIDVDLAAVNGPKQCTVAGSFEAIDALASTLAGRDIKHKKLNTSHGFHSFMMEPMLAHFGAYLSSLSLQAPSLSYYSNVTGELITKEQATSPDYWQQHIRQAVRFHQGVSQMASDPTTVLVEVGPGTVLTAFAKQAAGKPIRTVSTLAAQAEVASHTDIERFTQALGDIQANGVNVDWQAWYEGSSAKKIRLPLYPFAKRAFSIGRGDIGTLLTNLALEEDSHASGVHANNGDAIQAIEAPVSKGPQSFAWQKVLAPVQQYSEGVQPCLYFQPDNSKAQTKAPLINAIGGLRVSQVAHDAQTALNDVALGNNKYRANLDSPASLRRLLTALRKLDDIPDLMVSLTDLSKTPSLPDLQTRTSALCTVLTQDYPNQAFTLMLLLQSREPLEEADQQKLALWQRQLQASMKKVTLRLVFLPYDSKANTIQMLAKKLEREIFDEQAQHPVIRLSEKERCAYEMIADDQYQPGPLRFNQKHFALLVPQGYPVEPLQQRLQLASGAAVTPIELSLQKPIQAAIEPRLAQLTQGLSDTQLSWQDHYQLPDLTQAHQLVDEYCLSYLSHFLMTSASLAQGDTLHREALIERLTLPEQLHRYADYFIHMLQEDGFLSHAEASGSYTLNKSLDTLRDPADILKDIQKITHLFDGQLTLVRHAIDSYNKVLSNEIQPIEVLYPDGSNQLIQETYTGSIQHVEDELIMSLFEDVFKRLVEGVNTIRIMEVGGGYGMAMRRIMPMLAHVEHVEFWFTDVGSTFLADAKQFALEQGYDHMTFGVFDITKPAKNQGLPEGYFDLIYAYNVVHATKHIGQVASNLEPLLNDNGVFCLLERTNTRRYVDLAWGMADGWWHFDAEERALSPLVSLPRWTEILQAVSFESVATYPADAATQKRMDVGLIIAQARSGSARKAAQSANQTDTDLSSIWRDIPERKQKNLNTHIEAELAQSQQPLDCIFVLDTQLALGTDEYANLDGKVHPAWQAYENYYFQACEWIRPHSHDKVPSMAILSDGNLAKGAFHNDTRWLAANRLRSLMDSLSHSESPGNQYVLPFSDALDAADASEHWHHVPSIDDLQHVLAALDSDWHYAFVQPEHCSQLKKPVKQDDNAAESGRTDGLASALADGQPGGKSDYANLLIELMKPLFGLDQISSDDDFFALGGDSLKVAQLTTELEKHGIKIMPNEVFNFPKVSQLATYLHQHFGATSRQVESDDALVEHLKRQLGLRTHIRHYHVIDDLKADSDNADNAQINDVRVLYLDDNALTASNYQGQALVEEMLSLNLDKALQPDYVFPASKLLDTTESVSLSQFNAHFAMADLSSSQIQHLVQQVKVAQRRLGMSMTNQPVEMDYAISPFQKMYLKTDNRVSLYQIELDEIPDRELLNQAFLDVVRRQGLMRSSLQRNFMNKHRWLQHQTPSKLVLPYLDLSHVNLSAREKVVEALMTAEYEADFDNENSIMFHVVLIRHQLNRCTLLFNLDHSIFDNMSGQVLRRQLINRYRTLRGGSTASMPPVRSFDEYLNQINAGPQGITPAQMIEQFELDKYGETKLVVENHIVANRQPKISQLQYKVRLADWQISDDDEVAFEVTLSLLSYGLAKYFGIDQVPMKLIYQGRKYHDLPFFDTLGLFVDIVPLLIDASGTPSQMISGMNQKIQSLNRYNINFMNMVLNLGMLVKWRDVVGLTSPKKLSQKDPMILLNYAGKAGQEYRKIIDFATSQMLDSPGKLDYASFYAIATSDDEHIVLDILCNFETDMSRFSDVLDEALNTVFSSSTPLESS